MKAGPEVDRDIGRRWRHTPAISPFTSTAPAIRVSSIAGPVASVRAQGSLYRFPQQVVRIAAGQESCRRNRSGLEPERHLVIGEDPGIVDRRQRTREPLERLARLRSPKPGPASERRRRSRTEDVKVPASEFATRLPRVHVGRRHGPDDRLVRAIPAQEQGARRGRVSEAVWGHAHLMTG
jgi:hypothetical protein